VIVTGGAGRQAPSTGGKGRQRNDKKSRKASGHREATAAVDVDEGSDSGEEAPPRSVRVNFGQADKYGTPEWMRAFRNVGFTCSPEEQSEMERDVKSWHPEPEEVTPANKEKLEGWPWSQRRSVNTQYMTVRLLALFH
jgi:hypothetical protein